MTEGEGEREKEREGYREILSITGLHITEMRVSIFVQLLLQIKLI